MRRAVLGARLGLTPFLTTAFTAAVTPADDPGAAVADAVVGTTRRDSRWSVTGSS